MSFKKSCLFAGALFAAAVVFSPGVCQAGLFDCFNRSEPTTDAPPYQAQRVAYMPTCDPCNPCAAAPQVNYVPEVKYRWKYARIERTEYQPVASADPCTGCPRTSYRPVTKKSMLPWLHREAYTTYKAVPYGGATPVSYMQPTYQTGACNPCATSCDPCGSTCDPCGGASSSMVAPSLSSGVSSGCSTCAPSTKNYPDSGYSSGGQTFDEGWKAYDGEQQKTLKPQADPKAGEANGTEANTTAMPKMVIPQPPSDKTASVNRVRTVSYDEPARLTSSGNLQQAATVVIPLRLVPIE
jgi:hypothetical protein